MAVVKTCNKDSKFWISKDNWNKIIAYAESAYHQMKSEIGGQMVVVVDDDGAFILENPVILKQEVSAGNCEMEAEALAVHYSKMAGKYGDDVRHCWWHSHHTMGAFWSGTDDSTILGHPANDWTVSLVVNLKREYKLRIQFFEPFLHEENVELNIMINPDETNPDIDKEVNDLCNKETTSVVTYGGHGSQGQLWNQATTIRDYNRSFQQNGHHDWWNEIDDELCITGIPVDTLEKCIKEMDEMIDGFMDGTVKGKSFR